MIALVITGGQSGADLGAWRAAKNLGIKTGGFMPYGFLTEDGPKPEYESHFCAQTCAGSNYDYRRRTIDNVAWADAVLWFGDTYTPGGQLTRRKARDLARPLLDVHCEGVPFNAKTDDYSAQAVVNWLEDMEISEHIILMVAGNRESRAPGIEKYAYDIMTAVFGQLVIREKV